MLKMPANLDKPNEQQPSHLYSQPHQHQRAMKNLLFDSEQLTAQCYARSSSDTSPIASAVSAVQSVCTTSPLDQLIKLQERLQQGEFSSSSASSSSAAIAPLVKTPPAISSLCSTSYSDTKSIVSSVGPQSLLDTSSLVLSTYANATQLAGPMSAAATAPWASSAWQWSAAAAATETAALLNGTYGGGGPTTAATTSAPSNGGWNGAYFGNAFGGLVSSNQFGSIGTGCFSQNTHQQQHQITPTSSEFNLPTSMTDLKNSLATTTAQRSSKKGNGGGTTEAQSAIASKLANNGTVKHEIPPLGTNYESIAANSQSDALIREKLIAKSSKQQRPKTGGKVKSKSSSGKSGNSKCECPNCKAGIPNKHNCHIPGCHKIYGKSSHLKAHLKWHKPKKPPTTKKRLFDPPDNLN